MNKWEYGEIYKKYNMNGEISIGTGIIKVHNIFDKLPEFMKNADVIFCDPPCSKGNINSFYTKADRNDYQQSYEPFKHRFFECIDEIKPRLLFIEVFKSNIENFIKECKKRYKYVKIYNSFYYNNKKNQCWIIQTSNNEVKYPINNMDEAKVIAWICANIDFECIGDLCMGKGLVGYNAFINNKSFVGTELNKKRLAILVNKVLTFNN